MTTHGHGVCPGGTALKNHQQKSGEPVLINSRFMNPKTLKAKVIWAGIWMYILNFSKRTLRLLQTIILARILTPEHFGIVGVATIAMALLELFSNVGLKKTLIQRKELTADVLDVAWTTYLIRGIIIGTVFFISAPLIADFMEIPRSISVIRAIAFCFVLDGLRNIGIIYFSKDLQFHKRFICEIGGVIAGFIVSISLVFILRNEWAIVWAMLASSAVYTLLSYTTHPYRPRLKFDWTLFKELFEYSKWIILTAMLAFIPLEGIKIALTKLLGPESLGIYIIALRFSDLPAMIFGATVKRVLFPAYAQLQDDPDQLKDKYLKTIEFLSFFCIPLAGAMVIFAAPIIQYTVGPKWMDATVVIMFLAPAFCLDILTNSGISLFYASGKPNFSFYISGSRFCILLVCIVPGITYYGLAGAAASYMISSLAAGMVWLYGLKRLLKITFRDFSFSVFPVGCTLSIALAIILLQKTISLNELYTFLPVATGSAMFYIFIAAAIDRFTRYRVLKQIKNLLPKKTQPAT